MAKQIPLQLLAYPSLEYLALLLSFPRPQLLWRRPSCWRDRSKPERSQTIPMSVQGHETRLNRLVSGVKGEHSRKA